MYVRFVVKKLIDRKSHERLGVIRAASYFQRNYDMPDDDNEELNELFGWFNDFLMVPERFTKRKRRYVKYNSNKAISWFKDEAKIFIRKAREIGELLERNGMPVEMLVCENPGYVVYEDEYQVAAIPFRKDN